MKFKFKKNQKPIESSCLLLDLMENYVKPSDLLVDEKQAGRVTEAVTIISQFISQASEAGIVEYI